MGMYWIVVLILITVWSIEGNNWFNKLVDQPAPPPEEDSYWLVAWDVIRAGPLVWLILTYELITRA